MVNKIEIPSKQRNNRIAMTILNQLGNDVFNPLDWEVINSGIFPTENEFMREAMIGKHIHMFIPQLDKDGAFIILRLKTSKENISALLSKSRFKQCFEFKKRRDGVRLIKDLQDITITIPYENRKITQISGIKTPQTLNYIVQKTAKQLIRNIA